VLRAGFEKGIPICLVGGATIQHYIVPSLKEHGLSIIIYT